MGKELEDGHTIEYYSISKDSLLHLMLKLTYRIDPFEESIERLERIRLSQHGIDHINSRCINNKLRDNLYILTAYYGYVKAISQIYGLNQVPTIQECVNDFDEAQFDDLNDICDIIKLFEEKLHYGILIQESNDLMICDALKSTVIVEFSTSEEGLQNIYKRGELLEKPDDASRWSVLASIDDYDFNGNYLECTIQYYDNPTTLHLKKDATHRCDFYILYYTFPSIKHLNLPHLTKKVKKFIGKFEDHDIDCALMDSKTAAYSSNYIFKLIEKSDNLSYEDYNEYTYIGYEINQWIYIHLNK